MCPNMEGRRDWIIAVRLRCLVVLLASSLWTDWCHLIPSTVLKHHRSRAPILYVSTLVTARHSDPYRKTGRILSVTISNICYISTSQPWSTFILPSSARSSFMTEDRGNNFAHIVSHPMIMMMIMMMMTMIIVNLRVGRPTDAQCCEITKIQVTEIGLHI